MRRLKLGVIGAMLASLFSGPTPAPAQTSETGQIGLAYGTDPLQTLDLYRPDSISPAPVILFVHGGGWSGGSKAMGEHWQPAHYLAQGYAWATMDYRLVPAATVEDGAADVARAFAWLRGQAEAFGIDPDRIVLMGHSAGAHLAALVATDPHWLAAEGLSPDTIDAVISLDGAGLDVVSAMAPGAGASGYHLPAFGSDVARQARLSPISYADSPNAPRWLFLHDGDNDPSRGRFAQRLAGALTVGGAEARVVAIHGTTHMRMINELGSDGDATAAVVDEFLDSLPVMGDSMAGR